MRWRLLPHLRAESGGAGSPPDAGGVREQSAGVLLEVRTGETCLARRPAPRGPRQLRFRVNLNRCAVTFSSGIVCVGRAYWTEPTAGERPVAGGALR